MTNKGRVTSRTGSTLHPDCDEARISRQTRYYRRIQNEIFEKLGRSCVNCRATEKLEFDVKVPVGDPKSHHGKMSSTARMAFYKRQLAADNLQVLCTKCNSSKRDREEMQRVMEQDPF